MINTDLARAVGSDRVLDIRIFQNDQSRAALGTQRVVIHMAVAHLTARLTIVGAHRGHRNAVPDGCSLYCDRFKNLRIFVFHKYSPYV